jgi:hypothetical protein
MFAAMRRLHAALRTTSFALGMTAFGTALSLHAADPLSGVYTGYFIGKPATLTIQDFGSGVTGRLSSSDGYTVLLNGKNNGDMAAGGASSPSGAALFELRRGPNGMLVLTLEEVAPVSGQAVRSRFEFAAAAQRADPAQPESAALEHDPRLVGGWQGSRLQQAGDMILRVRVRLALRVDGSFQEDADSAGDGSSAPATHGAWSTQGGTLRLRAEGSESWTALGAYQARGEELIVISADGSPQVWKKQDLR